MIKILRKATALVVVLGLPGLMLGQVSSCPAANYSGTGTYANSDSTQHVLGNHNWKDIGTGYCSYSSVGAPGVVPCATQCTASSVTSSQEFGVTVWDALSLPFVHVVTTSFNPGMSQANGAIQCGTTGAVAVSSCLVLLHCAISIGFSGSASGVGVSAGFSTSPIWSQQMPYVQGCNSVILHGTYPGGYGGSPIIIDTDGHGFDLTNEADGVIFDFFGYRQPIQISWTAENSTNGWLALPNANGKIDSARELFGNVDGFSNGFLKLAAYDDNKDGQIDNKDGVWPALRVWIDKNHNGKSEKDELFTLDQIGIKSISLAYHAEHKTDQNGNQFRFRGHLEPKNGDPVDRVIYDVFLVTPQAHVTPGPKLIPALGSPVSPVVGDVDGAPPSTK